MKVGVIGAGLAGLSAACTLAARGYSVVVLERNDWLGGKAAVWEKDGYRFDMGPTILTLPSVLRRVFEEAGLKMEDRLDLVRLDPQWRSFFDDGSVLDLTESLDGMTATLKDFSHHKADPDSYKKFLVLAETLHKLSENYFFWRPVDSVWDIIEPSDFTSLSSLKNFLQMRPGQTVSSTVRSFIKDERVAQMLDHFVQYVGSSPEAAPAVLCGIAHMQTTEGVWYPMGGTRAVPVALKKLADELGVEFRTGAKVDKILHSSGQVTGVQLAGGETLELAAVVSNMDSVRTYRELLGGDLAKKFEGKREYEPACSGVVFYWGLDKRYEQLAHHDFVFSKDPEEEFDFIYNKGEPAPDPTCYLAAPAITEPGVAPAGGDALYVLVHTPYLRKHHDWNKMLPEYRKTIIDKLERTAGMKDLESRIQIEHHLTPQDIHDRYAVLDGAIYGLASHGKMNGAFKPGNRRELKGLYLAGGAAHPGPGMPMVTMSGWIAADALDQDGFVEKGEPAVAAVS
ncbi:MAG: phytoene desaturase [Candidatus Eremiobacteraeota bacterium]|nr:phytoene desaturase [Candidatus Eremiobacteraeota bacterium]